MSDATSVTPGSPAGLPTDDDRLSDARLILDRCDTLARHSSNAYFLERIYLSREHRAVNDIAAEWMREAGMRVWRDAAGNQCGRIEGREPGLPALLLASHLDTVPNAGRYDGMLGVLAAIAVVRRLRDSGRVKSLPFALEVAAFGDEEGTRFGATLLGSRALAGGWDDAWFELRDERDISMREAFERFGLDPARVGQAARAPESLVGYLELHIEQGPRLQDADRALGVVTSIAAARRYRITFTGESRHAATPFERRHDALSGASEAILAIERISRARQAPATVGRIDAHPGAVNVIPGRAEFSLDLRAESEQARESAWDEIAVALGEIAHRRGLGFAHETTHQAPEVTCSDRLKSAIRSGIATTGDREPLELLSIAGHDAMAVAAICEVGMIFVRCLDGISHDPAESVTEADVALAIDAFAAAVEAVAST